MTGILSAAALVLAGGFLGGLGRWALTRFLPPRPGTFAANLVGSVVLGLAVGSPGVWPLLAGVGFAGALSTWSGFANLLAEDVEKQRWSAFWRYLSLTLAVCVVAAWRGAIWAERIWTYWS
jgi:CrcB protein